MQEKNGFFARLSGIKIGPYSSLRLIGKSKKQARLVFHLATDRIMLNIVLVLLCIAQY